MSWLILIAGIFIGIVLTFLAVSWLLATTVINVIGREMR